MRDIKFRGKTTDNKYWVNGDLIMSPENEHYQIGDYIIHGGNSFDEPPSASYEFIDVINKTIGQYTGLKDKNGKEIYEGDIIKNQVRKKYKIVFKNYSFYFKSITNNEQYNFELYIKMLEKANVKKIEIIGNIHENPKLIK